MIYINFDSYYSVKDYNSFLTAAKNNDIEFEEFVSIKAPFLRSIGINDYKDLPSFLNYDILPSSDRKWLVSTLKATRPNEAFVLKRREGKDNQYFEYIIPEGLKLLPKKKYIMVFRSYDKGDIREISKKLGSSKIYKLGKAKGYTIYYTYNPYIRGIVLKKNQLVEFGKEARNSSAIKSGPTIPKELGIIEHYINYNVLVNEKLLNKTVKSEFWSNGIITPIKSETFI